MSVLAKELVEELNEKWNLLDSDQVAELIDQKLSGVREVVAGVIMHKYYRQKIADSLKIDND